ncbi:hypothetical protein [Arthrobacter sp. zg-Y750]|uniref:hypothetical protein n=1 Tax=Arthrobacter sp. zg-Y750 TaxID=2894189 RepID=UPI001E65656A|nr:hypothetical protein [Arthrobacter sp. zg-Y750]MCC9178963.1 hypothetical protein [Arthrobacter sp. zg-Y750]
MSRDWTVLGVEEPTQQRVVDSLVATMPHLTLRQGADSNMLAVLDDDGTVLLALELPRLVRVPEEALRLLTGAPVSAPAGAAVPALFAPGGNGHPDDPLWWQEIHAMGGEPATDELADRFSHVLAGLCCGVVIAPFTDADNV